MKPIAQGFSLLEVILVLILMGLMMSRFAPHSPINTFHLYLETQEVLQWLQRAHRLSLQLGCQIEVRRDNNQLSLHYDGYPTHCNMSTVTDPITGEVISITAKYLTLSGSTGWTYTALGEPIEGQQTLLLDQQTVHIEAETGVIWMLDNA